MENFDKNQYQQPAEQNRLQSETIADIYRPPAPRADDNDSRDERQRNRDDRREQRRDRINNLLDRLRDSGGLDGLLNRLGQGAEVREKLKLFVDFISDIKGIRVGREDGKIKIDIERNKPSSVDVNQKQGPVHVEKVDLADRISFKVSKTDAGLRLDDIQGIAVKGKFDAGIIKKDLKVDLRTAQLEKQGDKPALKVEVSPPDTPAIKLPITIPLERKK